MKELDEKVMSYLETRILELAEELSSCSIQRLRALLIRGGKD